MHPTTPATLWLRSTLAAAVLALLPAPGASAGTTERPAFDPERPAIAAFIAEEVARDGFEREELRALFGAAQSRPELTAAMTHPIEKTLPWWQYRARFVTSGRIAAGLRFWQQHRVELDAMARESGVPSEYVVAILGMETNYGDATGSYREIDTLMTLAFDFPPRAAQYRSELRAFLLLTREAGLDPLATRGSYAGALGAPQFLPSSYRRYAVNASKAAHIDLWTDWADIFSSTARFLTAHGWQRGRPAVVELRAAPNLHPQVSGRLLLNDTVGGLEAKGLHLDGAIPAATPVVLVAARLEDRMSYRAGFRNLRVLAHYNPSINYVLAVCDLAAELRRGLEGDEKRPSATGRPDSP